MPEHETAGTNHGKRVIRVATHMLVSVTRVNEAEIDLAPERGGIQIHGVLIDLRDLAFLRRSDELRTDADTADPAY